MTGSDLTLGLLLSSALSTVLRSLLYDAETFQVSSLLVPAALLGLSSLIAGRASRSPGFARRSHDRAQRRVAAQAVVARSGAVSRNSDDVHRHGFAVV